MSRYRLSPAAQRDLSSIWDHTVESWDEEQAETYLLEIRDAIERLVDQPRRGRAVDEIRVGYRRYAIGSHLIFFIVSENDEVHVIRVLHQRMDPTRHL